MQNWTIVKRKLIDIKTNKYSTRKEFEIKPLANSIFLIGLENLPAIDENDMLIYGERRTKALKTFQEEEANFKLFEGLTEKQKIKMFYDENERRKNYTPAEREMRLRKIWDSDVYKTQKEMADDLRISFSRLKHIFIALKTRNIIHKSALGSTLQINKISTKVMENITSLPDKTKIKIVKDIIGEKQLTSDKNIRERVAKEKLEIKFKKQIKERGLNSGETNQLKTLHDLIVQREKIIIPSLNKDLEEYQLEYSIKANQVHEKYDKIINFPNNDADSILTCLSEYHSNFEHIKEQIELEKLKSERKILLEKIDVINNKRVKIIEKMNATDKMREQDINSLIFIDEKITKIQDAIKRENSNIKQYNKEIKEL